MNKHLDKLGECKMIIIIDDSAKIQKERKEQHKEPFIYLKINDLAKVQKEGKKEVKEI